MLNVVPVQRWQLTEKLPLEIECTQCLLCWLSIGQWVHGVLRCAFRAPLIFFVKNWNETGKNGGTFGGAHSPSPLHMSEACSPNLIPHARGAEAIFWCLTPCGVKTQKIKKAQWSVGENREMWQEPTNQRIYLLLKVPWRLFSQEKHAGGTEEASDKIRLSFQATAGKYLFFSCSPVHASIPSPPRTCAPCMMRQSSPPGKDADEK